MVDCTAHKRKTTLLSLFCTQGGLPTLPIQKQMCPSHSDQRLNGKERLGLSLFSPSVHYFEDWCSRLYVFPHSSDWPLTSPLCGGDYDYHLISLKPSVWLCLDWALTVDFSEQGDPSTLFLRNLHLKLFIVLQLTPNIPALQSTSLFTSAFHMPMCYHYHIQRNNSLWWYASPYVPYRQIR